MGAVTATKLVNKALEFIGVAENPVNSNNVLFNTVYYGHEVNGEKYKWDLTFIWYMFKICGGSHLYFNGKKTISHTELQNYFKKLNRCFKKPEVGDIMLFTDNTEVKAGIVLSVLNDSTVKIIEGCSRGDNPNISRKVMIRSKTSEVFYDFLRPEYAVTEVPNVTESKMINVKITDFKKEEKKEKPVKKTKKREYTPIIASATLKRGDRGKEVSYLREDLIYLGYTDKKDKELTPTGQFGLSVEEALMKFQEDNKLEVTGIYDPETEAKMKELYK